jgi:D-glycero-D-manno-heptose 1,7-bisphosphate phosphatase
VNYNIKCKLNNLVKVCFLDRDGTIIYDKHYLNNPDEVEIIPSAITGMKMLSKQGFNFYVISNQSGISRKLCDVESQNKINSLILEKLSKENIMINEFIMCPHHPNDNCECRKPNTKMFEEVTTRHLICKHKSIMIGDKLSDMLGAKRFGICGYHVKTGEDLKELKEILQLGFESFNTIEEIANAINEK